MPTGAGKVVVRRYFAEVHNQRDISVMDQILVSELIEPTKLAVARVQEAFPDYEITIDDQISEEDKVTTLWTLRGTHEGDWESPLGRIAPTGKAVSYTGTSTFRLVDGKIAEVIGSNHDHLGLLQQMGALPAPVSRPGA